MYVAEPELGTNLGCLTVLCRAVLIRDRARERRVCSSPSTNPGDTTEGVPAQLTAGACRGGLEQLFVAS